MKKGWQKHKSSSKPEILIVLKKINMTLSPKDIKDAVEMVPETVERILFTLRYKIDQYFQKKKQKRVESANNKRQ